MTDGDLRLGADGYLDMDQFDDEPLGFLERHTADRFLQQGLDAGLSGGWQQRLGNATDTAPVFVAAGSEPEVLPLAPPTQLRPSGIGAPLLRLAAAAAAVMALVLGVQVFLDGDRTSQDPAVTPATSVPQIPTTTAPTSTAPTNTEPPTTEVDPSATTEVGTTTPDTEVGTTAPTTEPEDATTTTAAATTTTTVPVTIAVTGPSTANPLQTITYTATGSGWSTAQWEVSGLCTVASTGPSTVDILFWPPGIPWPVGGSCSVGAVASGPSGLILTPEGSTFNASVTVAVAAPTITVSGPTQAELGEIITVTASGTGWTDVFWSGGPLCGVMSSNGATAELQCSATLTGSSTIWATARYQGQTVMVGGSSVQAMLAITVVDPSG